MSTGVIRRLFANAAFVIAVNAAFVILNLYPLTTGNGSGLDVIFALLHFSVIAFYVRRLGYHRLSAANETTSNHQ